MKKFLAILVLSLLLEWKNGSRKNPNDHILRCFALYNKYHLLGYQMKLEGNKKEKEKLDNSCEEYKKERHKFL